MLCTNQREEPCCKILVSLSKEAAMSKSWCAGVYERTNLLSMGREVEDDPSVLCTNQREEPCCKITVSLSKGAAESKGYCAGVYESTNLLSMGRKVSADYQQSLKSF